MPVRSKTCLFVIALVVFASPLMGSATAYLNKPIGEHDSPQINSWVDHTSPEGASSDASTTMTRSTGATSTGAAAALSTCSQYNGGAHCYNGHSGLDYDTQSKTGYFVVAAAGGTVKRMGLENPSNPQFGYGYYMRLWHSGQGHSTIYAHLDDNSPVQFGIATSTVVSQGQRIALSGDTGEGEAHLHFGVIADDSADLTKARDPYGWTGTSGQDPWPPNSPDEENLWLNASSVPVSVDAISPSTATNETPVSITSVTGINFRLGWDKETNLNGNWRMDEVAGTAVADVSGTGNDGTASGGVATTTGKLGNARSFDGVNDSIKIQDSASVSPTDSISLSIWFKRGDSGREQDLFSKYNSNINQASYRLVFLGTDKLRFVFCEDGDCSPWRYVDTSDTITDTNWHHAVGTFASSTGAHIYLDGIDVSSNQFGTSTSIFDSSAELTLSSVTDSSGQQTNFFKGDLDEARLYNRALLPSEVMELYKATAGKGTVKLTKTGESDIACSGFNYTDYKTFENGSCPITNAPAGARNVVVTNPDGTSSTLTDGFTITRPPDPTITSISPSSGSGSVSITSLGGTNFRPGWDKESNLLGNWRMDESTGLTVADLSGNGYDGTASGTATTTGQLSNARDLTTTGDFIGFGDVADLDQSSPASVVFWWKGTPTTDRVLLWKEEPSGLYRGYSVFQYDFSSYGFGSGVKLVWRIGQNDVGGKRTYCISTTPLPNDGAWHHYVITQAGGTSCGNNVNIYIDGMAEQALIQNDSGAGNSASSTASLYVGNGSGYAGPSVVGTFDEVRIYNRALLAHEIGALWKATGPGGVKLTKQGESDITCTGFTWSSSTAMTSGTCDVTGATTGSWNVKLTNPNNASSTPFNGFTVQ